MRRRTAWILVALVSAARTASPAVTITDATDEGIACFKIVTDNATYYYDKAGGGFTSMLDTNNVDWINFHPQAGSGSAGEYRGIPNTGQLHPGYTGGDTTTSDPLGTPLSEVTINTTRNGWGARWEFFPTYAKMTLHTVPSGGRYWMLYEGTPGGAVEASDRLYLSNGRDYSCNDDHPWKSTKAAPDNFEDIVNTSGAAAGTEWVYFAASERNRSLFMIHNDDSIEDDYWQMENNMTVFGFGRSDNTQQLMSQSGAVLFIGFKDAKDYATLAAHIDAVYTGAPPPPPVPDPPTGVSATDGTYPDKVRLTWNSSSGATAYEVWRSATNNSGSATRIRDNHATRTYDDASVTPGTTYYYWVKAKNSSGTSGFSASDAGHAYVDQPPPETITVTAPTGGTYKGKQDITIRWTSSNIPGEVKIEFSENGGSSWQVLVSATENDGNHKLDLPNTTSANCVFRVSDLDGTPWDDSGTFSVTQINDQDGDRLDDDWETSYWGDTTTSDGTTDTDGDGLTDLEEFWRDRDPTVAESAGAGTAFACTSGASGAGPGPAALALVMIALLRRREAARRHAALP